MKTFNAHNTAVPTETLSKLLKSTHGPDSYERQALTIGYLNKFSSQKRK